MNHIEAIAEYIQAQGLGVYDPIGVNGDIYIDNLPAAPDEVIMIRATGGTPDEYAPKWGLDSSFPSVQIIVRSDKISLAAAANRAEAIYKSLRRLSLPYDGGRIFDTVTQAPAMIGTDENGRAEYSINLQLETN